MGHVTRPEDAREASMRPRHKAAENQGRASARVPLDRAASMRPRHKAAENPVPPPGLAMGERVASMRPRHKAAENIRAGRLPYRSVKMLQ